MFGKKTENIVYCPICGEKFKNLQGINIHCSKMHKSTQLNIEKKNIKKITPLTKDEILEKQKKWKESKQKHKEIHLKNKADYEKQRENLIENHEGEFIALSNGNILGISSSQDEIFKFIENDPTVFVTQIGNEDEKASLKDVLLTSDLRSTNNQTCFPYHPNEQDIVLESEFTEISGYCGSKRPFISILLKHAKNETSGMIVTFLIDTQSPLSYVQPEVLSKLEAIDIYSNMEGTSILFTQKGMLLCVQVTDDDKRLDGINLLGSPFLNETGFLLQSKNNEVKIIIQIPSSY
jgi:hypothetical protein